MDIIDSLRTFLSTETPAGADILTADPADSLIEKEIVNSMTLLKLVSFMEETFGISILDEDISKRNFRDLQSMKAFVEAKQE